MFPARQLVPPVFLRKAHHCAVRAKRGRYARRAECHDEHLRQSETSAQTIAPLVADEAKSKQNALLSKPRKDALSKQRQCIIARAHHHDPIAGLRQSFNSRRAIIAHGDMLGIPAMRANHRCDMLAAH